MNGYSTLLALLRPQAVARSAEAAQADRPLLPRTAADELPPYREQPWIIDRRGYRKRDEALTVVPKSRV